jgi:hypothetical protein
MNYLKKYNLKPTVNIFLAISVVSIILTLLLLGFCFSFWIIVLIWIIVFLIFFIKPSVIIINYTWFVIFIVFFISLAISVKFINLDFIDNKSPSSNKETSADGIALSTCTSTANDEPAILEGWKTTIYSAPLLSNTPGSDQKNNIKTFSYSGIKNKTEKNSIYVRIEKTDSSYITGYGTTIEACTVDNKTAYLYTTSDTSFVASENVIASEHYLHGGKYLHGAGDYRIDVYIKDLNSKWHLVDRIADVTITE